MQFFKTSAIYSGTRILPVASTPALQAVVEDMIETTQALGAPDAAQGILAFVKMHTQQGPTQVLHSSKYTTLF